ncbi:sulfur carrier protein ThiS [Pragia fontium]|uniref:sulfur carrier protein ThiS n=1 Tax=Pragia fontium TaxID=82985 RepID=UPI000F6EAC9F|nr:sulfur carrier protein ThiS [Pragia fontium]VEJ56731.1 Thiamine biosynthesis protein ThiS [Pragia fontium]
MQISVNDQMIEVSNHLTVALLLEQLGKSTSGMAMAINQEIQPRTCWDSRLLNSGDNVLLFQAIAGG